MKTENLLYALADIRERYIVEYGNLVVSPAEKRNWKRIVSLAACLVLVCSVVSFVYIRFAKAGIEDPRGGIRHTFENLNELDGILPPDHIFRALLFADNITLNRGYGYHDPNAEKPGEFKDYYSFYFSIQYQDGVSAGVNCEANLKMPLSKYLESRKKFQFVDGEIAEIKMNGHTVYYAHIVYPDGNALYCAVFKVGDDFFEVFSDKEDVYEVISRWFGT